MPWAKLDDRFHENPKVRKVWRRCPAAIGLYVLALAGCGTNIGQGTLDDLDASAEAIAALVSEGLWYAAPGGYVAVMDGLAAVTVGRPRIPARVRDEVLVRDRGICQLCGGPVDTKFHIDHIVPVARGGATAETNLQLAHPSCNLGKGVS